jgi:hypothetical protein
MQMIRICLVMLAVAAMVFAQRGHAVGHTGRPMRTPHTPSAGKHTAAMAHQTPGTRLAHNTALTTRLQGLLPPGTDMQLASSGFKNLGQFVAAVHVSNNLKIPFDQLKLKMTGPEAESLGKAIQDLRPAIDHKTVKADVKTAERQAKKDLAEAHEDLDRDDRTVAEKR